MLVTRLTLLFLGASLLRECSCVIWEPKDSSSGARGRGQISPQVFELEGRGQLQTELQDLAKKVTGKAYSDNRFEKRQAEEPEVISTIATLTNDSHFHAIVHWTGYPRENIFVLTRKVVNSISEESWLWRSTDYGKTFINETYKLSGSIIQQYYVSFNTSYLIFADVLGNKLQITDDYGETFTSVDIPFTPTRLLFQSKLAPNTSSYSKYFLGYDALNETLWITSDLGYTWTKIGDNVPAHRYFWRRLGADIEGDLSTVYFEQRTPINRNESRLYFTTFPYTTVQQFSTNLDVFQAGSFVLSFEYMFVQKLGSAVSSNVTYGSPAWVGYKRGRRFDQALFPFLPDALEYLHYAIVDASEGLVFVAVYHDVNTTNLYTSDVTGTRFVLSLKYVAGSPREDWTDGRPLFDVHVVEGVTGTVLANQRKPGRDFGTTLISHNKGGTWSPLTPPTETVSGQPLLCTPPDCSLHVRMESDVPNGYQSILSQETAVGLLIAVGNTGRNLSRTSAGSRVYLSRDGGFTWTEVESGRWEFQYLALGSIIVMVKKGSLVRTVKWSCDEGANWRTSDLEEPGGPTRIYIIGMKTELGERPRLVTLFALDYYEFIADRFQWIIFTLNFTSVVPTQCETTDYFSWAPTDERPYGECLLGEVASYERRNSSSCCYVDPDYQKPTEIYQCPCSIEDYECDFGFERQSINAPCTPVAGFMYPPTAPLYCPEGDNYTYTSGYRKIPGDRCIETGEDISSPRTALCPIQVARGTISFSPSLIQPGSSVTFILRQTEGTRKSTVYRWDFNDSTPAVEVTGFDLAQTQVHTFARPGVFYVKVLKTNEAGTFEATVAVSVLDSLVGFSVTYPSEIVEDSVPIDFSIEFSANVETQYRTKLLRKGSPFELSWDFGDGTVITNSMETVQHTYTSVGSFNISTSVTATYSSVDKVQRKTIRTYQAARTVNITSDGLTRTDNRNFARVQQPVSFQAVALSSTEIPPQTSYTWVVQDLRSLISTVVSNQETLSYSFPTTGEYIVSVTGSYMSTGSFFGSIVVSAQNTLVGFSVMYPPEIVEDSVPTGFSIEFSANVSTQYITRTGSPFEVSWDFGDGTVITNSMETVRHTYTSVGSFIITTSVKAVYSTVAKVQRKTIRTYQAARTVNVTSDGLTRTDNRNFARVQQPVSFQAVALSSTEIPPQASYTWVVQDLRSSVRTVVSNQETLSYSFQTAGEYIVSVTGSYMSTGSFFGSIAVSAQNTLVGFSVMYPPEIVEDSVPTGFSVEFSAKVSTQYMTRTGSPFEVSWDFGDGTVITNSMETVRHTYTSVGSFIITISVKAVYSTVAKVQRITIRTYQAARTVNVTSDGLTRTDNRNFARVQQPVSFQAVALSSTEIPPQTSYTWTVQDLRSSVRTVVSNQETLSYSFQTFGEYLVSVTGEYMAGGSFSGSIGILAQNEISGLTVTTKPTVRVGTLAEFQVSPMTNRGSSYMGPITARIETPDGTQLASYSATIASVYDSVFDMTVSLKQNGSFEISVYAFNDISEVRKPLKITVVDTGEYGALSILFNAEKLPENYQGSIWRRSFLSSLTQYMATKFNHKSSLIEPLGTSVVANDNPNQMFLVVDVNILPADNTKEKIQMVYMVLKNIVNDVTVNKAFTFSVDGVAVTADHAYDRNKGDDKSVQSPNNQASPIVDIVLAVVIIVVAIIAIVVVIILIYFCHRRYVQLQTKYSHLEESAGGNLAFNDAYENELPSKEKEMELEAD